MKATEYAASQAAISAATAYYVMQFGQFFLRQALSLASWLAFLQLLFPEVERRRGEAAALAREFYDSQRAAFWPNLPRNDVPLEGTNFETFVRNMDPVRRLMSQEDAPDHAITHLGLQVIREVENAGRRQIIHAVEQDTALAEALERLDTPRDLEPPRDLSTLRDLEPPRVDKADEEDRPRTRLVRGWARVATGRETCAWCLMLISRGPVYLAADRAGLDLDDESAVEMIAAGEDVSEFMDEWHPGCDCKVVPVFDLDNWPGRDAAKRAEELWAEATKIAIQQEDEGRLHRAGKRKGKPFTRNELAINALRRMLERGEIDPREFAAFPAV